MVILSHSNGKRQHLRGDLIWENLGYSKSIRVFFNHMRSSTTSLMKKGWKYSAKESVFQRLRRRWRIWENRELYRSTKIWCKVERSWFFNFSQMNNDFGSICQWRVFSTHPSYPNKWLSVQNTGFHPIRNALSEQCGCPFATARRLSHSTNIAFEGR